MKTTMLSEAAKEARRLYYREYRARNAEKLKEKKQEYNRTYWERKAVKMAAEGGGNNA